ncbi:MFS transporter [Roseicella aerolata]|uniref:MFS transporter n=1 Tax=Roseicella aerolata TaxID=2883479 RepID=A0A9X1LAE4_9PROT|nr:MFS transporter [Roseicella aerolata]MCB4822098.1 MFS transporter [Roseicella aerolata]
MSPRDAGAPPPDPAPSMTPAALRAAFFRSFPGVAPSIIIAAIDQTIVATALPAIAGSLGVVERISWVVVAWLIAATIAAPVFGRLGDAFGRRRLLLAALILQALGALISATAAGFPALLAGRLLQGFGGGGLATLTMALIAEAVPPRERGRFQAWIVACFTTASCLGPLLGGWLTGAFGWRAVFWAMLPASALAFGLALRIPPRPGGGGAFRFDLAGVLLFAAFVTPALLALQAAQRLNLAAVPGAIGLALLAGLAFLLLLRQEKRARDPLLPLPLLAEPSILRSNLLTGCAHGALVALITFLPIWLQSVRGLSPATAGLMLLPLSLGGGIGGLTAGRLMTRTGIGMPIAGIGLGFAAAGLLAVAWLAPVLSPGWLALLFGLVATGMGTSYPVSQITVQVAAGPARLGAAAGSVQFSRTLGAAMATTLLGALLFGTLAAGDAGTADLFARLVREGPALLPGLAEAERSALKEGLTGAFRAAYGGAALLAAAGSWLAWRVPVRRI